MLPVVEELFQKPLLPIISELFVPLVMPVDQEKRRRQTAVGQTRLRSSGQPRAAVRVGQGCSRIRPEARP